MRVCISALLLLVHILAQARLFFRRQLFSRHLRLTNDVLGGTLRVILLSTMDTSCRGGALNVLVTRLVDPTAGAASLAVRSLILGHDVLEDLLIEVPTRFVLV